MAIDNCSINSESIIKHQAWDKKEDRIEFILIKMVRLINGKSDNDNQSRFVLTRIILLKIIEYMTFKNEAY